MKKQQIPKRPFKLLKWFCKPEYLIDIEGDVKELYERRVESLGKRKAQLLLWKDIFLLFRPGIIRPIIPHSSSIITYSMLRHNFLISYRSFLRNKTTFLINVFGLSTALAASFFIYLWIDDEISMDTFHENDEQLYQVMHNINSSNTVDTDEITPIPLAEALLEEMPEVEAAVSVNDFSHLKDREGILIFEDLSLQTKAIGVSEDFFNVFSFPLLQGSKDEVLSHKDNVAISADLAEKLFGTEKDILGKSLKWEHPSFEGMYQIAGVFDIPPHSSKSFDIVLGMEVVLDNTPYSNINSFRGSYAETFIVLSKGTNIDDFNDKIADLIQLKEESNTYSTLFVQRYSEKYLNGRYENGKIVGGRIAYVKLFLLVGLFILLIASVNFMNLSTARASRKMKEIGVKKVIGAHRRELIFQFLSESLFITFLSTFIAVGIVLLFLPYFNSITGKQLLFHLDYYHLFILLGITVFTGLIAGSYPAFYLSAFNPISILKGRLAQNLGELLVRKGLVIFQFTLSIIFIVAFWVLNKQIEYTQTKNMGYSRDQVISAKWKGDLFDPWDKPIPGKSNAQFYAFMDELRNTPGVKYASNMYGTILNLEDIAKQSGVEWSGQESDKDFLFESPVVGYDFIKTLGITLKEGRAFSEAYNDGYDKIMLNESAVKMMNMSDPVGKTISLNGNDEIIGVVKDFHYGSLYNGIEPLIFRCEPHGSNILIKLEAGSEQSTIQRINQLYAEFVPNYDFEYALMDEQYQAQYEAEMRVATLSHYMAILAIIISCLGLLGLATFTAERRQKEIGIRKVLGADVTQLVGLLTIDFARMVLIAICISIPVSYFLAKNWLDEFTYRIELQWWYFAITALLTILIACITVASQTLRAASVNPIYTLKED